MGIPELHHDETIIYQTHNIKVKSIAYDAVLTNKRLILIDRKNELIPPKEILIATISNIEPGENAIRDPILTFSILSKRGITHQMILTFPRESGGERKRERNDWCKVLKEHHTFPENPSLIPELPAVEPKSPQKSDINHLTYPGFLGSPTQKKNIENIQPKKNNIVSVPIISQPAKTISLPISLFCSWCGHRVPPESAFCDKCGKKIISHGQRDHPELHDNKIQDEVLTPQTPIGRIVLPPKKISISYTNNLYNKEDITVTASRQKEHSVKKTFFPRSVSQKRAVIVVLGLISAIVFFAVFFVLVPSNSPDFNLTSHGVNFSFYEFNFTYLVSNSFINTTNISKTILYPIDTEPVTFPQVTSEQPAITQMSSDPVTVLDSYAPLFNSGDGAGLHALLSENIKLQYPVNALNNELATALSNGYIIEKMQVNNQNIEGNIAILETDISWNLVGSPITSTQNLPLVYENDQWKLDTLILSP